MHTVSSLGVWVQACLNCSQSTLGRPPEATGFQADFHLKHGRGPLGVDGRSIQPQGSSAGGTCPPKLGEGASHGRPTLSPRTRGLHAQKTTTQAAGGCVTPRRERNAATGCPGTDAPPTVAWRGGWGTIAGLTSCQGVGAQCHLFFANVVEEPCVGHPQISPPGPTRAPTLALWMPDTLSGSSHHISVVHISTIKYVLITRK